MTQASKQLKAQAPTSTKPKAQTLAQRVDEITVKVTGLTVETPEQSIAASSVLREAALLQRDIEKDYKERRAPHVKAQKDLIAEEKTLTAKLIAAQAVIDKAIKALAEKLAIERAEKERAEREKREAEARAEAQLRADQLRAAAAAAPTKAVAKRLEAQADVVQNAQPIIDPVPVEEVPQLLADGLHGRKGAKRGTVDSLEKLVLQIAAGIMLKKYAGESDPLIRGYLDMFKPNAQATIALVQADQKELDRLAVAFPSDLELQGVRVTEDEDTLVARR